MLRLNRSVNYLPTNYRLLIYFKIISNLNLVVCLYIQKGSVKYLINGFGQSVVVGIPNFNENNQYQDQVNLSSDFYIAKKIVLEKYGKARIKKAKR